MKAGSIVECVNDLNIGNDTIYSWEHIKKGNTYTVAGISYIDGIILHEAYSGTVKNEYHGAGLEAGWNPKRFREIEFPPLLEEEIKECLTRELVEIN